ncbi:hypothetical protein BGZ65_001732 [Modicella reniformis]|uniref:START domain-containing protein n=1 Tax=Modicella reniformis TaxID=1440133 RepID=A0A9P6SNH2_9FUNG|nr:hypothetical protein BGZ65_001732 [Modicella reniformis]
MKRSRRTTMVIGDESIEWIEQHHRNTSHRSLHQQHSPGLDIPSGDESDSTDKHRQTHFYTPDPLKQTKESHIDQAAQAIQLLKAASKPTGWKKVLKHKSGCLVYQSTGNNEKHPAFKGEHVIRGYRAQEVFSVVGVRKLWDDWYDELRLVESYDDSTNLMYMVMKGSLSAKTRDISMVERIEVERDGTIYFASCSVESSKLPRISGKVRADIFVAGWIIQPLPSNPPITKITYVIQTDLLSRMPKFIARRALAKRPLVITTIETHLRKNGVPMVMSNLVSQTTHRHRSLSEPLKPEKFLDTESEMEEKVLSGSAFLSPMGPIASEKDVEQLNDRDDDSDDDNVQMDLATVNENISARVSRESLVPSHMSHGSLAPSIFAPEFLEGNARLGDSAHFGDSKLFGKGGIFESTLRQQDDMSVTSNDESRSDSPQPALSYSHVSDRARAPMPSRASRMLLSERDSRYRHSVSQRSETRSSLIPRNNHSPSSERATPPHVVTPATPPLTPTTSLDGKDASDSDASVSSRVKVVPRTPKEHADTDTGMSQRPNSMAFAAYGVRSPSDIMESRRHSTLVTRSSSFAPRHSHILPFRGNANASLQNLHRMSSAGTLSNAMKRMSTATSLDSNRSSTLLSASVTLPHRHSEKARKALAMFKVLAASPEDRWRAVSSDGAFKTYSRVISGAGLPMLRGEGVITGGWTVEQINAVIESTGCRQIWDERFDTLSVAETFNANEYLFHVTLQNIGSLTGRDLAGVTIIDRDPQTSALYNVSTSVLDSTIPEDPGRVRAILELSGWSLRPIFDGRGNTLSVNVTYVIQIDIRGTLSNSVIKSVSSSMMTPVTRLNHFINKTGHPPFVSQIAGSRYFDTFDPKTGQYELCYKAAPGWTEVRVGRKVYRDGYDFFIKPDDPTVRVELAPDFGGVRVFTTLDHEGQSIIAQVTRKGHNSGMVASKQSVELPQEDNDGDDDDDEFDEDKANRRKHDSATPRRSRDSRTSRTFESSSPTFGGPSLRKSSSHLKSNDQKQNAEQVDDGSSADAGGGSDQRLHEAPSSIARKRRSASYTTLSAFDPNLIVASSSFSSNRLNELLQTTAATTASQESEKSRSRSTPRNLEDLPAGTSSTSPVPSSAFATPSENDASTSFKTNSRSMILSPITITTSIPTSTMISSPMFSPTLGPLKVPRQAVKPSTGSQEENTLASEPLVLKEKDTLSVVPDSAITTIAILQPAASIFSASSRVNALSKKNKEKGEMKKEKQIVISLAAMSSPLASPLPDFMEHSTLSGPNSRLKHSSSASSINALRRVTFSPDVVDKSDNRSPSRIRRGSKNKSISSTTSPLTELQNFLKADSDEQDYESDEAEFVEAQSDQDDNETEARKSISTLEFDHMQDHEEVWRNAVGLFIEELNSTQIKLAIVFLLLIVYASNLSPLVLM